MQHIREAEWWTQGFGQWDTQQLGLIKDGHGLDHGHSCRGMRRTGKHWDIHITILFYWNWQRNTETHVTLAFYWWLLINIKCLDMTLYWLCINPTHLVFSSSIDPPGARQAVQLYRGVGTAFSAAQEASSSPSEITPSGYKGIQMVYRSQVSSAHLVSMHASM